ncbi:hypothetical protein FOA52_004564 [Chlamydomonas sp. UWO 241]|nr:hypothetical protein FOA52_004564 [Chlamydomonas sp. UWO 241]
MDQQRLMHALGATRDQAIELMVVIDEDQRGRVARWEDERPSLEKLVASLTASYDIVKVQRKKALAELASIKRQGDKLAEEELRKERIKAMEASKKREEEVLEDLQVELIQLNNRLLDIDDTIAESNREVADGSVRQVEKEIHSTRLVVMQDTRRLLQAEITGLRETIMRIHTSARIEEERKGIEESGFSNVTRLDEALVRTAARLDRAKQQLYFPAAKGYRFSTGNSGVYFAAHDLFISELSGRFDLDIELVTKPDGSTVAQLKVSLGGAAGEDELAAEQNTQQAAQQSPSQQQQQQKARPQPHRSGSGFGAAAGGLHASPSLPTMREAGGSGSDAARAASPAAAGRAARPAAASFSSLQRTSSHVSASAAPPQLQLGAMAAAAAAAAAASAAARAAQQVPPSAFVRQDSDAVAAVAAAGLPSVHAGAAAASLAAPLPSLRHKAAKGDMVASFFSGLSKKKSKVARAAGASSHASSSSNVGGDADFSPAYAAATDPAASSFQPVPEHSSSSRLKISKLARTLADKADSLTDRIGSKMGFSSFSGPVDTTPGKIARTMSAAASAASAAATASRRVHASTTSRPEMVLETTGVASIGLDDGVNERPHFPQYGGNVDEATGASGYVPAPPRRSSGNGAGGGTAPLPPVPVPTAGGSPGDGCLPAASWRERLKEHVGALGLGTGGQVLGDDDTDSVDGDTWGSSLGMHAFEARPSRRGVYVQFLGEQVEVVGERGTKVPNVTMRELLVELEVAMTAVIEYSPVVGWKAPDKINLSIITLNHRMRGSSLPLPAAALRAMLGLYLPGMLTRTLIGSLPSELGAYVAASGEPVKGSGELRVLGQQLSTYVADLAPPTTKPPSDLKGRAVWEEEQAAAGRARTLLGLSEAQACALAELFHGRNSLLGDRAKRASICELCRFYVQYSGSRMWHALCNTWNRALQVCFDHFGVSERFTFNRFMEVAVARLARKPLRVCLTLHRLSVNLDVDIALATVRDFFERAARELYKKGQSGESAVPMPNEPIEVQLDALSVWHSAMSQKLRTFKSRFKSMGCSLLASADRDEFQVGADGIHYDGPLQVRLPLDVLVDPDNSFVLDVKLPDKEQSEKSMVEMLQETLRSLAVAEERAGGSASDSEPSTPVSDVTGGATGGDKKALAAHIEGMIANAASARTGAGAAAASPSTFGGGVRGGASDGGLAMAPGVAVRAPGGGGSLFDAPLVGQVSFKRIALGLKLDEERMQELLGSRTDAAASDTSGPGGAGGVSPAELGLAGQLMGCFGDLFNASIDVGWKAETEEDGSRPACCMLKVSNNDITRVCADIESLMFQSTVSPKLAVRMLYAVVANLMLRFYSEDSFQLRFWHQVFAQLFEYLGKESLDVTVCLSAHAYVVKPPAQGQAARAAAASRLRPGRHPPSSGAAATAAAAAASGDARLIIALNGGSDASGLSQVRPFSLVNDVNLLTVLDSFRLFEMSSTGGGSPRRRSTDGER